MGLFSAIVQGPGPADVDLSNRASIGTITLPAHARLITKVSAYVCNVGTKAEQKPLTGYIQLESSHINIEPFNFPFAPTASHLGVTPHSSRDKGYEFNVNCPIPKGGNAQIDVYCVLGVAAPQGAPEVGVEIEYSDDPGYATGPQMFMDVLEPSGAVGTTVDTETTLTAITLYGASKLVVVAAVAEVGVPVADESLFHSCNITCSEFLQAGDLEFFLEPKEETDATTGGAHLMVRIKRTDRDFKNAPTQCRVIAKVTNRDGNTAGPEVYVWLGYV